MSPDFTICYKITNIDIEWWPHSCSIELSCRIWRNNSNWSSVVGDIDKTGLKIVSISSGKYPACHIAITVTTCAWMAHEDWWQQYGISSTLSWSMRQRKDIKFAAGDLGNIKVRFSCKSKWRHCTQVYYHIIYTYIYIYSSLLMHMSSTDIFYF